MISKDYLYDLEDALSSFCEFSIKSIDKNLKVAQWFLDPVTRKGPDYFKNKSTAQKEHKKRRKYVTIDKAFLADMDKHIAEVAFVEDLKPAHAYNNFISNDKYSSKMDNIIQDILDDHDLEEVAIEKKICKTYKNRYFIQQKSNCLLYTSDAADE